MPPKEKIIEDWKKRFRKMWKFSFDNEKGTDPRTNCELFIEQEFSSLLSQFKEIVREFKTKLLKDGSGVNYNYAAGYNHGIVDYEEEILNRLKNL